MATSLPVHNVSPPNPNVLGYRRKIEPRSADSMSSPQIFRFIPVAYLPFSRYVQELETRLLHMETLFNQVTPILEQLGQPETNGSSSSTSQSPVPISPSSAAVIQKVLPQMQEMQGIVPSTPPESKRTVKFEEEPTELVSEAFEQLALDEHGHFRWIGNSSTMSLIQSFRALTASPLNRVSPMEDSDPRSPMPTANKLYFPASVSFGQVQALPGVADVEYPSRDLADALVSVPFEVPFTFDACLL